MHSISMHSYTFILHAHILPCTVGQHGRANVFIFITPQCPNTAKSFFKQNHTWEPLVSGPALAMDR